jgi:phosphonatase-like hydrolase
MMQPELLVTDLAGTILSDDGVVLAAYRQAFTRHDIVWDEDELATLRGASKRMVFERFAGRSVVAQDVPDVAAAALATFQAALTEEYEHGDLREIDGATDALQRLKSAGVMLAVTSGFPRELVDLILGRLGWIELFDTAVGADQVSTGRPAPFMIYQSMDATGTINVKRVAVVGDTPLDLQAATNSGAGWAIGVLSGAHGIDTLGRTTHTHLLASVASLPGLFAGTA